jgi:CheY-like chemotaxis protein
MRIEATVCYELRNMPSLPTILIVDDDPDNRFLLAHGVQKSLECAVVACSSAAEALALVKTKQIDAIVTDHHLGDQTGSEFIGQLRRRGVTCPMVMVTGSSDPKVEQEAYRAGATKVFPSGRGDYAGFVGRVLNDKMR